MKTRRKEYKSLSTYYFFWDLELLSHKFWETCLSDNTTEFHPAEHRGFNRTFGQKFGWKEFCSIRINPLYSTLKFIGLIVGPKIWISWHRSKLVVGQVQKYVINKINWRSHSVPRPGRSEDSGIFDIKIFLYKTHVCRLKIFPAIKLYLKEKRLYWPATILQGNFRYKFSADPAPDTSSSLVSFSAELRYSD